MSAKFRYVEEVPGPRGYAIFREWELPDDGGKPVLLCSTFIPSEMAERLRAWLDSTGASLPRGKRGLQ